MRAAGRMLAGRIDEALALVAESESLITANDSQVADLAIMRGDLHMAMAPADVVTAEASYQKAFDLPHERGLRMAELQAATRLATLHRGAPRAGLTAAAARCLRLVHGGPRHRAARRRSHRP
jgi:hypothetical protein